MKSMVRCAALDMSGLAAQEAHGKREDRTSQQRKVRDVEPDVFRGLDLRKLYDAHIDGVKQNAGAKKPVLHFIVRFPPELLDQDGKHFKGTKEQRQRMMLRQAITFINQTHGGDAVFAARLDKDELGETIADVFAAPKYEKRTKRTPTDKKGPIWASATKFGKELADKHQEEILRRHPGAKGTLQGPRAVGIALNAEWRNWFERVNELKLSPKVEKVSGRADRLETEAFKDVQDQKLKLAEEQKTLREREAAVAEKEKALSDLEAQLEEQQGTFQAHSDMQEIQRRDLRKREEQLRKKESMFEKMAIRLVSAVRAIEAKLSLKLPDKIYNAVLELEQYAKNLSREEPSPEADTPHL